MNRYRANSAAEGNPFTRGHCLPHLHAEPFPSGCISLVNVINKTWLCVRRDLQLSEALPAASRDLLSAAQNLANLAKRSHERSE